MFRLNNMELLLINIITLFLSYYNFPNLTTFFLVISHRIKKKMEKTTLKNQLLKGTLILTIAGLITRILGFLYRIFLVKGLGETNLGIYQLIFPLYSICFTLYAAGIQTAVSQLVANKPKDMHARIIKSGFILSLSISFPLSLFVHFFSSTLAWNFLGSSQTAPLLRLLSIIFPLCGLTAIINGYFYGIKNAKVPAITQILEQVSRVISVFVISYLFLDGKLSTSLAVLGLLIGELISNIYNMYHLQRQIPLKKIKKSKSLLSRLLPITLPLSGNKLIVALLGSMESILIPQMLCKYGYSYEDSLALFGILTGIVLPFILFPGTITNSLSVLLLPEISHASGNHEHEKIKHTTSSTLRYSILLGVLASSLFFNFGQDLGSLIFHSENGGKLLSALSFLCPFLYVGTTLNSIINGLGKTNITFLFSILSVLMRITFLLFVTPIYGIYGYLFGFMISEIFHCILSAAFIIRKIHISIPIMSEFVWPLIFCNSLLYLTKMAGNLIHIPYAFLLPALFIILFYFRKSNLLTYHLK